MFSSSGFHCASKDTYKKERFSLRMPVNVILVMDAVWKQNKRKKMRYPDVLCITLRVLKDGGRRLENASPMHPGDLVSTVAHIRRRCRRRNFYLTVAFGGQRALRNTACLDWTSAFKPWKCLVISNSVSNSLVSIVMVYF